MTTVNCDRHSLLKKILTPRLRLKNNAHLIIRAVEAGYDLSTIEELLGISPQTEALSSLPQLQQQNYDEKIIKISD